MRGRADLKMAANKSSIIGKTPTLPCSWFSMYTAFVLNAKAKLFIWIRMVNTYISSLPKTRPRRSLISLNSSSVRRVLGDQIADVNRQVVASWPNLAFSFFLSICSSSRCSLFFSISITNWYASSGSPSHLSSTLGATSSAFLQE